MVTNLSKFHQTIHRSDGILKKSILYYNFWGCSLYINSQINDSFPRFGLAHRELESKTSFH